VKIYVGFDSREKVAYDVCKHSIEYNTHKQTNVIPLIHNQLRKQGFFARPWLTESTTGNKIDLIDNKPFATEFSHTRFLVPALMNYKGWALFMDCDMIFTDDIKDLFDLCDDKYAVMVVKHNHKPKNTEKMDGQQQTQYYRKNWSSFILWNCGHPLNRQITPELVNTKSGAFLHQFHWLPEMFIGALPMSYNWIEDSSPVKGGLPSVIHYTNGGPWFNGYKDVMFAEEWWKYYTRFIESASPETIIDTIDVDYRA
jgi:lipopolysaccharide biosynthesis glycosyltransferase